MEDEDAFLYGDSSAPQAAAVSEAPPSGGQEKDAVASSTSIAEQANGATQAGPFVATMPAENASANAQQEEESEGEDMDEDTDESDSDLEIILDNSIDTRPPPPPKPRVTKPQAPATTDEYTPLQRGAPPPRAGAAAQPPPSFSNLVRPAPSGPVAGGLSTEGAATASANVEGDEQTEGPPPSAPSTAPVLNLEPTAAELEVDDGKSGDTVYHLDPTTMDLKPWRRAGTDLTDYFNYGFDEESWKRWGEKKRQMIDERREFEKRRMEGFAQMAGMPGGGGPMGMPNPQMMAAMMGLAPPPGMGGMGGMGGMMPPGMDMSAMFAQMPPQMQMQMQQMSQMPPQMQQQMPMGMSPGPGGGPGSAPPFGFQQGGRPGQKGPGQGPGPGQNGADGSDVYGDDGELVTITEGENVEGGKAFLRGAPTGPSGRAAPRGPSSSRNLSSTLVDDVQAPSGPSGFVRPPPSGPAAERDLPANVPSGPRGLGRTTATGRKAPGGEGSQIGGDSYTPLSRRQKDLSPEMERYRERSTRSPSHDVTTPPQGSKEERERDRDREHDREGHKKSSSSKRPRIRRDDSEEGDGAVASGGGRKRSYSRDVSLVSEDGSVHRSHEREPRGRGDRDREREKDRHRDRERDKERERESSSRSAARAERRAGRTATLANEDDGFADDTASAGGTSTGNGSRSRKRSAPEDDDEGTAGGGGGGSTSRSKRR